MAAQWADKTGYARARTRWPGLAVLTMLELAQMRIPGRGPDVSAPLFTLLAVLAATAIVRDRAAAPSRPDIARW